MAYMPEQVSLKVVYFVAAIFCIHTGAANLDRPAH
jgi:hypothetical protein